MTDVPIHRHLARRLAHYLSTPRTVRRINGWFTVFWLVMVIPTVAIWSRSILWVAVLSIWANVATHYGAWLTARVEVRAEHVEVQIDDHVIVKEG